MKIKHIRRIIIVGILLILILWIVFYCKWRSDLNIKITVRNISNINSNYSLHIDNKYYYSDFDGIYCLDEKGNTNRIFSCNTRPIITSNGENIIICTDIENSQFLSIDFNRNILGDLIDETINVKENILLKDDCFYASDGLLFSTINDGRELKVYDINNNFKEMYNNDFPDNVLQTKVYYNDRTILNTINTKILQDNIMLWQNEDRNKFEYNICFLFNESVQRPVLCKINNLCIYSFNNNEMIFSPYYYWGTIFKINTDNKNVLGTVDLKSNYYKYKPNSFNVIQNKIIMLGQEVDLWGLGKMPDLSYTDELKHHGNDYVCYMNTDQMKIENEFKTKKYERIIFCDLEKVITYYKGKILTYSIPDWKVIKKEDASYIKNNGSYEFINCGEKIFVYQGEKIINIIDIT